MCVGAIGPRNLPLHSTLLPVVDKPAIQYVVEEAAAAGLDDVLMVTGRHKRAIEDHFDHAFELELAFAAKGDTEHTPPGRGGEIQLTDALREPAAGGTVYGVVFKGSRHDTGDKADYLRTVVRPACERADLGPEFVAWLKRFIAELGDALPARRDIAA